ncbi:SRPBCC family protein [Parerythrobacter aestuarii]|uniref:SRPBCC family protein n=1 Tax=Parerythrobacter aestuarii TaxID=3020909 RepID=UPI0024DE8484|nr:SRPBCC domain-containing protein [Parerythrobacter aestuarii]
MILRTLTLSFALALAAVTTPAGAETDGVSVEVIEQNDGTRTLVHEGVIDAPVPAVWAALATPEGWKLWGPKEAWLDFRLGGSIETSYNAGAKPGDAQNIRHRILAYVPEQMIALQVAKVPEGAFKEGLLDGMWSVYELEPVGDSQTRLRVIGIGYKSDPDSSQLLEFFKGGNTYSMQMLEQNIKAAGQ